MEDQSLRQWAASHKIHPDVVDDPRMPGSEGTPITLREWADKQCEAEGITDPARKRSRWISIQRWPQRRKGFPRPAIFDPPRTGRGAAPAIYVEEELDAWADTQNPGRAKPENIERLRSLSSPMTLTEIARVLGLHVSTLDKARSASLVRLSRGADPDREVPTPVQGSQYDPEEWGRFWQNRPGQGRRA